MRVNVKPVNKVYYNFASSVVLVFLVNSLQISSMHIFIALHVLCWSHITFSDILIRNMQSFIQDLYSRKDDVSWVQEFQL